MKSQSTSKRKVNPFVRKNWKSSSRPPLIQLKAKYSIVTMLHYLLLMMLVYNTIYVLNKASLLFLMWCLIFDARLYVFFTNKVIYFCTHLAPLSCPTGLIDLNSEGLKFSFEVKKYI